MMSDTLTNTYLITRESDPIKDFIKMNHQVSDKEKKMIKILGVKSVLKRNLYVLLAVLLSGVMSMFAGMPVMAGDTTDPMVKITSLPIEQNLQEVMAGLSADVSSETGLDENFVTYYWQTFDEIYCPGCKGAKIKEPIFVDLYVPGFMPDEQIQKVMTSLAASLEKHTDYDRKEIFMHTHVADLGRIFITGVVVTNWKQAGGPDSTENKSRLTPVENY